MHHRPIHPHKEGVQIGHFQVKHRSGFNFLTNVGDGGVSFLVRLSTQQQLPTFFQQYRIAPAFIGFKRVACCGLNRLAVAQRDVQQGLLFERAGNVGDFFVTLGMFYAA